MRRELRFWWSIIRGLWGSGPSIGRSVRDDSIIAHLEDE